MNKNQLCIKRAVDIFLSFFGLVLLIPVFLIIAIAIKFDSKGKVFFLQNRVGKEGKCFRIYKFRTMLPPEYSYDKAGKPLENYDRITKVGNFLRKTSLDELPQLINVLVGDMSLVGPRPTLQYQVEKYTSEQRERLNMLPGITGWAQVNGRNELTWEEKINLDRFYVNHFSILLDMKILLKTFLVVIGKKGVEFTQEDHISRKEEKL